MKPSLVNDTIAQAEVNQRLVEISVEKAELEVRAVEENRQPTASEARKAKKLDGEAADLRDQLDRAAGMESELAKVPRATDTETLGSRVRVTFEPSTVYRPDLPNSFFADLVNRGQSFEPPWNPTWPTRERDLNRKYAT